MPSQYHVLRNVLVRDGSVVLVVPRLEGRRQALVSRMSTLHVFEGERGARSRVALQYETMGTGSADPFSACVFQSSRPA